MEKGTLKEETGTLKYTVMTNKVPMTSHINNQPKAKSESQKASMDFKALPKEVPEKCPKSAKQVLLCASAYCNFLVTSRRRGGLRPLPPLGKVQNV